MSTPSSDSPAPNDPNDPRVMLRKWQLLVEELNRLNAQLEYVKLMLKLDLLSRDRN